MAAFDFAKVKEKCRERLTVMSGKGRIKKCAVKRIVLHKHERNGEKNYGILSRRL